MIEADRISGYWFLECPQCDFSMVLYTADRLPPFEHCPLCLADSYHRVGMACREAREADRPEGRDERQHDDHTWIVSGGVSWKITRMHGPRLAVWRGYEPFIDTAIVDISNVNWDSYTAKAVAMLGT